MEFFHSLKAFTLFTAMVSFIVIGIGVIVIQHISNSEQNYFSVISSLLNQQEMDAAKDLIRLDSLVTFNILYRAKFFDYYDTNVTESVYHPIDPLDKDWNDFVNGYIRDTFYGTDSSGQIGSKFAIYVANKMLSLLYDYRGNLKNQYFFRIYDYYVHKTQNSPPDLFDTSAVVNLTEGKLREAFNNLDLTLLNCSNQESCPNGSFYTNLDITQVDYSTYLNLPRVLVKRNLDNSAMDDSILPRNVISLYIPMRLFGAIAFARKTLSDNFGTNFKDVTWGDIDVITKGCSQFNDKNTFDVHDLKSKEKKKEEALSEAISNIQSSRYSQSFFDLNFDSIEDSNSFVSDNLTLTISSTPQEIIEFKQEKLGSVKVNVSVIDNNPIYSFGHNGFKFGFYAIVPVQDPNTNNIKCNCDLDPTTQQLSNCKQS